MANDTLPAFDPNLPSQDVPAPIESNLPAFDPSLPSQDVNLPESDLPAFDQTKPSESRYSLNDVKAASADSLAGDPGFAPIHFSVENEAELANDPEAREKVIEAYRLKETKGTTLLQKGKTAAKEFIPTVKRLAGALAGGSKTVRGLTEAPQRMAKAYLKGGEAPAKEAAQLGADVLAIPAAIEGNVASYTELSQGLDRAAKETVKGVARAVVGPGSVKEAVTSLGKTELTPEEFRARYEQDVKSAKLTSESISGQGPTLKALGLDADKLKEVGIEVNPEKIGELAVVTDPLNFVPVGAAVGVVGKGTRALAKNIVARTTTEAQAAKLATFLNQAKTASVATARGALGSTAETLGSATAAVGRGLQTSAKRIGGGFGGLGLGGILGSDVYSALGGAVLVKTVPKTITKAGEALTKVGQMVGGKIPTPKSFTLAGEAVKEAAIGTAEGAVLVAPFVIGSRTEDEAHVLGMVPLGGAIRAATTVGPKTARVVGEAAQDKLGAEIFKKVQQPEAPVSPYYGTDQALDTVHASTLAKLEPQERNFVNLLRTKFEGSPVEIYAVDAATMKQRSGNETASGFAIEAGEKTGPGGTTPVFRIYLNEEASALPHEAYHAFEFLDPQKSAAFEKSVADALTPEQKSAFEKLYNTALNGGKPEAAWTRRLTGPEVTREVAAEAFSRIILGQDLSGVTPTVRKQAALFASGLLEKLGAPLAKTGAPEAVGGSDLGGVRAGTGSVKLGNDWITALFEKVERDGGIQPSEGTSLGEITPKDITQAAPSAPAAPVAPAPPATPPVVPVAPVAPVARNIRVTPEDQSRMAARAGTINRGPALAAAEKLGPEVTQRVNEVSDFIESGAPVLEITHSGVKTESTPESPAGRTARRAEQEAAYLAEAAGTIPADVRDTYQKTFVPVRWEVVGGKPQLLAMSMDKVLANIYRSVKDAVSANAEKLIPYEIRDGKLTDNGWLQAVEDLQSYTKNQANGYRGDGQKLTRPGGADIGLSIPDETPGYSPTILSPERADFQNLIQGLATPLTTREVKGQVPGNVKGQILAEANLRKLETPAKIRPQDIKKQEFKSQPGRSLKEVNPLRNKLVEAGVPVRELIEVTERVNAQDIQSVKPRPDLEFNAPVTDIIRGGFKPAAGEAGKYLQIDDPGFLGEGEDVFGPIRVDKIDEAKALFLQSAANRGRYKLKVKVLDAAPEGKQVFAPEEFSGNSPSFKEAVGDFKPAAGESVADYGKKILAMDGETFSATMKAADGGLTGLAYDIGLGLKDKNDLTVLKELGAQASAASREAMKAGDLTTAMPLVMKGQFFREAYEAATGTLSAKVGLPRLRPGRVSPFPPIDETPPGNFKPTVNDEVVAIAEKVAGKKLPEQTYAPVNVELATKIANFYDAAKSDPTDPAVQKSYKALADETMAQYKAMIDAGYTIEPWTGEGEPYKSSDAMRADVENNKHLYYLQTDKQFGKGALKDETNPMLAPSGIEGAPINDIFRAVHDFFGHNKQGFQFGPRGEFNAWKAHSDMYSPEAQGALAAETLAQNSWVNYFGDHQSKSIAERPFAEQKNIVIPDELIDEAKGQFKPATEAGRKAEAAGFEVRRINDPAQPSIAIMKDGALVGELITRRESPDRVDIGLIAVKKDERKKGLSEVMYRELGQLLKEQGVTEVTGMVVSPAALKARTKAFPDTTIINDEGAQLSPIEGIKALEEGEVGIMSSSSISKTSSFAPKKVKRDAQGRPLTKDGLVDFATYYKELAAERSAAESEQLATFDAKKYAPKATPKRGVNEGLTGWILPDGKFADVRDYSYHEKYLADKSEELNKKYGTEFSSTSDVNERLDALNKGFVRMRQTPTSTHVELNRRFWTPATRRKLEDRLFKNDPESLGSLHVTLLNDAGQTADRVQVNVYDLPEDTTPESAISEGLRELRGGSAKPIPLDPKVSATEREKQLAKNGLTTREFWINTKTGEVIMAPDGHEEAATMYLAKGDYFQDDPYVEMEEKGWARGVYDTSVSESGIILTSDNKVSGSARGTLETMSDARSGAPVIQYKANGQGKPQTIVGETPTFEGSFKPKAIGEGLPGFETEKTTPESLVRKRIQTISRQHPEAIGPLYQKDAEGAFIVTEDGRPKAVAIEYDLERSPIAKQAMKGIKGEEERRDAVATALGERIVQTYKRVAKDPQIKAGEKWYSTARTRLKKVFGDDSKLFAELLGATSARTGVETNYEFSLDAYNRLKDGEYDDIIAKYREGKKKWDTQDISDYTKATKNTEPTRASFLDWWITKHDLFPRQSNGKKFGMNSRAVLRVIDGSWREEVKGPKTPNFAGNLTGDTFEATIDVWAARMLHRLANESGKERWRILPENETGVTDADFNLGQSAFRKAADEIGIKPDSLQAILWFAEKKYWEERGWTGAVGAERSDFNSLLAETETRAGRKQRKEPQQELFQ